MFAADVQHRAQRHSTQCNIITHVEEQAVQVLPQLHRLHSKQKEGHEHTDGDRLGGGGAATTSTSYSVP